MAGFNMELDSVQTELALLEHSLDVLKDAARLDGVIDEQEQEDIDDLEKVIAETRQRISSIVEADAPPSSIAREPEPGTMESDAAVQAAEAGKAAAESAARAERDSADRKAREDKARKEAAARAEAEATKRISGILGEATTRPLSLDDLKDLTPNALEKLYGDLKKLRDKGDAGFLDGFVLSSNIGVVKGLLTAVSGPVIDKDDMRADAKHLLSIVQEHWVDDGDEAEIMGIIEYYAQTPETMDAFFIELDNTHYWGGIFDEEFTPLITALKRELEGGNGRRFVELMNRAKSERIQNYEDPEEVTFSGVLWDDMKSGQVRDQIFGYFKGLGDAGVGVVEGAYDTVVMVKDMTVLLVTEPGEFKRKLASVPDTVKKFWKNREAIYNHVIDNFMQASPEEQARMIGRITGELELFLATLPAASAKAADTTADVARGTDALADAGRLTENLDDAADIGRSADRASDAAGSARSSLDDVIEEGADASGDRFFDDVTDAELDELFENASSPNVKGTGRNQRFEDSGKRVPNERKMQQFDIEDIPLKAGETTAREAVERVRRVYGKKLADNPDVLDAWNDAREMVLSKNTLTPENYPELYEKTRDAFWRRVRKDDKTRAYFEDAGFEFVGGESRAPRLADVADDMSGAEINVSLDHIAEKAQGDNWQRALDADNLEMMPARPNTDREIRQARHPELRE